MRLQKLHIAGYKNLKDLTIDFSSFNGTSLLIGNNGTGKSNILEAISIIFACLYKNRYKRPSFDYDLLYEIGGHTIDISFHENNYSITLDGKPINKSFLTDKSDSCLPSRVIACYSGDNTRLWDIYSP